MVLRSHLGNLAKAQNCRKTWFSTERKVKCLYKWLVWLYCRHFLSSPSLWLQSVCLPGPRLAWGFLHVQRETFHVTLPLKIPLPFLTAVVFIPAFFSLSPPLPPPSLALLRHALFDLHLSFATSQQLPEASRPSSKLFVFTWNGRSAGGASFFVLPVKVKSPACLYR